jgi:hypothetical protein
MFPCSSRTASTVLIRSCTCAPRPATRLSQRGTATPSGSSYAPDAGSGPRVPRILYWEK